MKYVSVVVLAALLGLASATSVAAQERDRSSDDDDARVIIRDRDDDRRGEGRGETGSRRGTDDDVDRRRGRTGDVERGRSGRSTSDILNGRRDEDRRDRPRRGDDDRDDDDWDDRRQGDDDWDDRRERRRGDRSDDILRDRRNENRRNGRGGAGPPFCRSGKGHPVHGQAWCREKGFGVGGYDDGYWERGRTRDIYFPTRRRNSTVSGRVLEEVLGRGMLGQLDRRARNLRASGPMRGRWNGNSELRVYVGDIPIARFVDQDGDRLADVVYLRR